MTAATATLSKLLAWRPGGYLRASGVLFGWLAVRTAAQTVLFVLVARTLGADGYGALIAVMALAGVFGFAGMGATAVLVREGSRQPERLPELTGDLLRLWLVSTPVLAALALLTNVLLLGDTLPLSAMVAIVIAEVACQTAVDAIGRVHQSQDNVARMGLISGGFIIARLVAFAAVMPMLHWTPVTWAWGYCISSALYLAVLVLIEGRGPHRPQWSTRPVRRTAGAGLPFAFSYAAHKVQAEINKPMLARITTAADAGALSAAQRFTDLLLLPVLAMLETLAPRSYRAAHPVKTTFTLGMIPLAVAVIGGAVLAASAHWLPLIVGPSFEDAVPAVMLLAALPAVQVFRWLLGTTMTALDLQQHFFLVHGAGALTSIVSTAALIPAFGITGSIFAAYGTEVTLIVLQGTIVLKRANYSIESFQSKQRVR
ncbi:MAG: oligosaccharide flippase family protein [Pseudomonadota bacterium]